MQRKRPSNSDLSVAVIKERRGGCSIRGALEGRRGRNSVAYVVIVSIIDQLWADIACLSVSHEHINTHMDQWPWLKGSPLTELAGELTGTSMEL